ncbi:MAG: dethiobiotin synthase [Bacteroidetes bacterium]|nr:dethiobiotin synthase [Bacteroidota bacterium]
MKNQKLFITGIGTDVGKTVVSAIFAEALEAVYWKPVQAGDLENSDRIKISKLTRNVQMLEEQFCLSQPLSPHAAAEIDQVEIKVDALKLPNSDRHLIIEGAGGLLVPLSNTLLIADWIEQIEVPVILVSRHYLGSINHTLLSIEVLKARNIKIEGIVFVGEQNTATEKVISELAGVPIIIRIPLTEKLDLDFVTEQANLLKNTLWFKKWTA